jgi:hypothetical protein
MIKRAVIFGVILVLFFGVAVIAPGPSEAQFCRDEIACATVYSLGPVTDLVLCQFYRPTSDTGRGHVDYVFCQATGDPKMWDCDRRMPRGLPGITLTESEWSDEVMRCAKICQGCSSEWKSVSLP